jgi:hypothetical protein
MNDIVVNSVTVNINGVEVTMPFNAWIRFDLVWPDGKIEIDARPFLPIRLPEGFLESR